jgi:1-hydroxycarotenoid 3,4-desaturase
MGRVGRSAVVIVGGGVAGLSAAVLLASRGERVTVLERAPRCGGKLSTESPQDRPVDCGPTVLTMPWVFEELAAAVGDSLDRHLSLTPCAIIARHAWPDGSRLDLHADPAASEAAIAAFAGPREAAALRRFAAEAKGVYDALERTFIAASRPSLPGLIARAGLAGLPGLARIRPFATLWRALGETFADPRLVQLFGRYATYCGSSPFAAPATLMLVAHVEQQGVFLVEGGMRRIADMLEALARRCGAEIRTGAEVRRIHAPRGRVEAVELEGGERIPAFAVVFNGDAAALGAGLLGPDVAPAAPGAARAERSLSALTWCLEAKTDARLVRHNVYFSRDYPAEFAAMSRGALPSDPTVYVCAGDRGGSDGAPAGPERLFVLVNAPARGAELSPEEIARCERATFETLRRGGLDLSPRDAIRTTPAEFARAYPGTKGSLYGRATHGWRASFQRPGSRTRIAGLYLAGGSAHPGPGLPMAALSGRLAAESVLQDLASTSRSRPAAMPGGISTRSATTGARR